MPARFQVVVTDMIAGEPTPEVEVLGDIADVVVLNAHAPEDLAGKIEDADALMLYTMPFDASAVASLRNCKVISRCGVGFDNIDRAAARARGIPVANVPDYGTEEVADSALAMALALARGLHRYDAAVRGGTWHWTSVPPLVRLRGRVFGIVGLGRIGSAVALRAKAFGMDVVFFDPHKPDGYDKALGVRRAESLRELLAQSHIVSLHCPLSPESKFLIRAETIGAMRPGSFLVNTARGGIVDTACIPEAIARGTIAGAGFDVLPEEPPAADDPLMAAVRDPRHPASGRVILTPHSAFYSEEGLREIRTKGAMNCRRALLGEPLRNVVN